MAPSTLINTSSEIPTVSLKEQLRPLFCTTEINLNSDVYPYESVKGFIQISSEVFVSPFLVESYNLKMSKILYSKTLKKMNMKFPETRYIDSDHALVAPVKGAINNLHIEDLIKSSVIDLEFALDILAFDFKKPLLSVKRCSLIKFIKNSKDWKQKFMKSLEDSSNTDHNKLHAGLLVINSKNNKDLALQFLQSKETAWQSLSAVEDEVLKLDKIRMSVFKDDISKNPRGQDLELFFLQ